MVSQSSYVYLICQFQALEHISFIFDARAYMLCRFPPGALLPPLDREKAGEAAWNYYSTTGRLKKKYLGDRKYWYLNILGRDPNRQDPGEYPHLQVTCFKTKI